MEPGFSELIGVIGRGMVIGLVLAVPVGPIGMLCIVRTLRHGRNVGLATGLGAATADAIYAAIAIFGLTALTTTLISAQKPLTIVGAIAIGLIGLRTMRAPIPSASAPAPDAAPLAMPTLRATWLGTVALTLANPATILTFVGIFAGITTAESGSHFLEPMLLVGSVFVGSACWWLVLTGVFNALRARWLPDGSTSAHNPRIDRMRLLNAISGCVLITFGALAALHTLT